MKKLLLLIIIAVLGFGAYVMYMRPLPVKWEGSVIPVPHCPYCDATLTNPLSNECPECGKEVLWEGKEKLKQDLDDAGKAIKKSAEDASETVKKEVDKLRE
ncbi:MAG: hypothetical protein JXR97_09090 [Planctomycetes bacterium]|nr:hypothetical protein [Planctomycetota bacterium]